MSKEILKTHIMNASENPYTWTLYFFKIDRRSKNPYIVHKVRFKKNGVLQAYAKALMEAVGKYQIEKLEKIQTYTGENSKVTCDKISLKHELVKEQWEYLFNDMAEASDMQIKGKYNGYILTGVPTDEDKKSVTVIKMANPVIEMKKQKNIVFRFTEEEELDIVSDDICRLYMDIDMAIIEDDLYAFNLKVETLFNMENTMKKIKEHSIEQLLNTNAFSDDNKFNEFARAYTSPRTFVTLNQERMKKLKNKKTRVDIANILELEIDNQGKICFTNKEDASVLIRYICFKIFKDFETKGLLEGSNITKVVR